MITLKIHGKAVLQIEEASVEKILNIYPDEHLIERAVFSDAIATGELSLIKLWGECDKLLIPWQLFLLQPEKLNRNITLIEARRKAKFNERLIANRSKDGSGISLRIADRIIGLQEFVSGAVEEENAFCGMLNAHHRDKWPSLIMSYFNINSDRLVGRSKDTVLKYLIKQIEAKNIRVARGVLSSAVKLFPATLETRKTYRKSSGFVVHDTKVPYIFLPDEMGDNETTGRQILTLIVLLILVGTNEYDLYLTSNLELHINRFKILFKAFAVASEILLPRDVTDSLIGTVITEEIRDELASTHVLTPSATVVTLRQRGVIDSDEERDALLDSISSQAKGNGSRNIPKIDTAVKKLCGERTAGDIIDALSVRSLTATDAQYLMFGRVDKLKYATFAAKVGL